MTKFTDRICEEDQKIYTARLKNIGDEIIEELNHIYLSGAVDIGNESKSTIIRASIERVAEKWCKGNIRDFNNLKRI